MGTGGACFCHALIPLVSFEKPLAISEIDSGEKNAEKKEELYSFFMVWFIHRSSLYKQQITQEERGGYR